MAQKSAKNSHLPFMDTFAIYFSKTDKCWIAHSLRTDQFGTGDCVLNAFVDGMKAVDQVVELAKKQPDIQVLHEAPEEVQQIAKNAMPLPKEISEIAHKQLYGTWPKELPVEFKPKLSLSFTRRIREGAGV